MEPRRSNEGTQAGSGRVAPFTAGESPGRRARKGPRLGRCVAGLHAERPPPVLLDPSPVARRDPPPDCCWMNTPKPSRGVGWVGLASIPSTVWQRVFASLPTTSASSWRLRVRAAVTDTTSAPGFSPGSSRGE